MSTVPDSILSKNRNYHKMDPHEWSDNRVLNLILLKIS